jgi:DNA-binding LytR/AlgR family response regulator
MRPLRVVVADDERLMREQLCVRLREVDVNIEVLAQARNGQEALECVRDLQPDLVFLDIRMPVMTGIEAARHIAQLPTWDEAGGDGQWPGCEIVFLTAYDQYAVQAFEAGVVDYLLKPAEPERLALALQRVRMRMDARQQAQRGPEPAQPLPAHTPVMQDLLRTLAAQLSPSTAPAPLQWIQAKVGATIQMIAVEDVLFFVSDEKYTRVQTATREALIRTSIKELVDGLDMQRFWQIHRSTLVNVRAIAGVQRDERGRQLVSLRGSKELLEVSRSYVGLFKGM